MEGQIIRQMCSEHVLSCRRVVCSRVDMGNQQNIPWLPELWLMLLATLLRHDHLHI